MEEQVLIVNDIPKADLELMTAVYKRAGATKVEATKQDDDEEELFTVKATFPPPKA